MLTDESEKRGHRGCQTRRARGVRAPRRELGRCALETCLLRLSKTATARREGLPFRRGRPKITPCAFTYISVRKPRTLKIFVVFQPQSKPKFSQLIYLKWEILCSKQKIFVSMLIKSCENRGINFWTLDRKIQTC